MTAFSTYLQIILFLSITGILYPQSVYLENSKSNESADTLYHKLDSIIVKSSRYSQSLLNISQSVIILETGSLQNPGKGSSLDQVFKFIPGLIVNDRNNSSQGDRISIRGVGSRAQFGVRGIKIYLDGIPLTTADGGSQLNNIDINSLGRIEILTGPNSVLYGNSAGGVIYLESKKPEFNNYFLEPEYISGANGFKKLKFSGGIKFGRGDFILSANTLRDDGFREHSQSRSSNFNILSNVELSKNLKLNLAVNYFYAPYLLNPSSLNKEDALNRPSWVRPFVINQGSGKKVEQGQGGITVKYQLEEKSLETMVYGIYRNLFNPVPGRIIDVNRTGGGIRSLYVTPLEIFGTRIIGVVGGDFEYQSDNRKEYENDGVDYSSGSYSDPSDIFKMLRFGEKLLEQDESIIGLGFFAKMEIELESDLSVSAGLRYDNNNFQVKDLLGSNLPQNSTGINMSQFSHMLGLSYKLNRQFNLFANYSTAFQTPTMNELGNSPQAISGFNSELKPETFQNIELGMRSYLINYSLFMNLTIYRLKIKNMLVPYQNPHTEGEETYYRNAGEATNYGAELSTEWIYSEHLKSNLSVSLSDFRYDDLWVEYQENDSLKIAQLSGNKVPGIPEFRFSAGLKLLLSPFSGEVYFRHVNKYFTNDFNGAESVQNGDNWGYLNDGYFTVDLYLNFEESIKFGKLFIFSGINNIFNARYNASIIPNASGQRFFEPSSSRYWFFGIRISFRE